MTDKNNRCHPDPEHFAALSINSVEGEGSIFRSLIQDQRIVSPLPNPGIDVDIQGGGLVG